MLRAAAEEELRAARIESVQREVQLKQLKRSLEDMKAAAERDSKQNEVLQRQLQLAAAKEQLLSRVPSLELAAAQLNAVRHA